MTQQIEEAAREIAIRAQDGATESQDIHKRAVKTKDDTVENRQKVKQMMADIRVNLEQALAASIEALRASRLVCAVIFRIESASTPICLPITLLLKLQELVRLVKALRLLQRKYVY